MKRNQLALTLAGLLFAPVGAAFAQDAATPPPPPPPQDQAKQLQTITVTGSAVPRIDVETPSPVTVLTAQQIQRSGMTTVSDVVRSISADNSGSIPNAFANGFAAGSSGVALRGLTVNSTLVLVDGHRAASYPVADDGQRSFVDLNTIPLAAVDRIEVLKDGASSLYGADAIAGVVNIILKPNYKGVEGTVDVGTSQHGGGFTRKATLLAGAGDLEKDGHNGYIAIQYQKDNPIWLRQRGFPFNTQDLRSIGGPDLNIGQPGQRTGSVYGSVTPGSLTRPGDITSGTPNAGALAQPLRPCGSNSIGVTDDTGSYCEQNFQSLYGQVQPAMEQGGIYGRFTMKINDTTRAYISASYFEAKTWVPGLPRQVQSSTPHNTNNIALPPGNPSNPFPNDYALINYAFGDMANGFNYDNHNARIVGGVSGAFGEWNYDVTAVINHDWLDTKQYGFISYAALLDAINNGTYNFANPAANSARVRSALAPGYDKTSTSDLDSLDLAANRSLWDMAGGPLGFAVGAQFRHESIDDPTLNPDFEFQGLGNAHTKGSRNVSAGYVEFNAPLLETLEMDVSGRLDHYSDVGSHFTPKIGIKWKPFDWVALRGTYSKGFRAPSFSENGSSSSQGFINHTPPADFIAAHGGSGNGYVNQYALSLATLANKDIKPEKARNYTLGVLVQPTNWLNVSVDYFNIKKENVIGPADASAALANYYAGLPQAPGVVVIPDTPDPLHPNALPRPAEIDSLYINATSLKTTGIDVDLQAHFDFNHDMHYISQFSGTQIFNWTLTLPDGTKQQFVGTHGPYQLSSGAGTPRRRMSWANTFVWGPATITGTLYHVSGMDNYALDAGTDPSNCLSVIPVSCHIGSFTYMDLTGSYQINDHIAVTASVMNLFDRKAPFDPSNYAGGGANYNPTYAQAGLVGRFYNLGVKLKL
ncbi:iron complex outermembrane recepter protein [Dyella marensis]|uniref:Iron complex outermembrane recepter protein n=1 Tax=Dyella marensis TaxID=500610 RepID=A0A1I2HU58_9GAMM|nr:iron complex outermembrane recepter protein [Dyella marensis]